MMLECKFKLNNQSMSILDCGIKKFDAFSGYGRAVNSKAYACIANGGPIPQGAYYIVDRPKGMKERIGDMIGYHSSKHLWFALYAIDGKIDDETLCDSVIRGEFRLHPKQGRGISTGCITIDSLADFNELRALLLGTSEKIINEMTVYGRIIVE